MTIEERVKNVIAEQLGIKNHEMRLTDNLRNDLGADSLDTIELSMALEEEFKLVIRDEETENVGTVGNVIDFISGKVK